jgi:hypothetical protein
MNSSALGLEEISMSAEKKEEEAAKETGLKTTETKPEEAVLVARKRRVSEPAPSVPSEDMTLPPRDASGRRGAISGPSEGNGPQ